MRSVLFSILISLLISCGSEKVETQPLTIDEIAYNAIKSMKENNVERFVSLFDSAIVKQAPAGQFDEAFATYASILNDYDLPAFNVWKDNRFFWQIDTVKRILVLGLPLTNDKNTLPEYVFQMGYSSTNKLIGINVNKTQNAQDMPDSKFPPKEDAFNYSFDSLLSIRLYYLPGLNSDVRLSKSISIVKADFTSETFTDFGALLADLNKSEITGADKVNSQQPTSNDLKGIAMVFKDKGTERSVFLISNNIAERELEINIFYITNATYSYQVSDDSRDQLKEDIGALIEKYIK